MSTRLRTLSGTPLGQGFRFPAEWEPQEGTWFSWPRPEGISFPGRYHEIVPDLARLVREVGLRQRVHINVPNENWGRLVRAQLVECGVPRRWLGPLTELEGTPSRRGRIWFHHIRTNESWCRDHGPAFVVRERRGRREVAIVDWGFNAWGGKYPPYGDDDAVPTRVAEEFSARKQKGFESAPRPRRPAAGQPGGFRRRLLTVSRILQHRPASTWPAPS
ncbi:agmatine deiminase family protein [Leptolyngbya sp. 15MV]|nr:agmatine deiminase family protein [Leptolyngbya sp. 15MV]